MSEPRSIPSPDEARDLLTKAHTLGSTATRAAGWPTAMIFNSLAILGSMLMIGFHLVAHTGYGAPLLAVSVGTWAAVTAVAWSMMHRTTKAGFSKRFVTSLLGYMGLYVLAILIGAVAFPDGNLAFYLPAAVILAGAGLAAAFRELRA
jgi:hypothetical protein